MHTTMSKVLLMNKLRIKDNQRTNADTFVPIPLLTKQINNKTLKQLEDEGIFVFPEFVSAAEDISEDEMVLQSINNEISTSNVMGFLGYKNERLTISSRFTNGSDDFFLQYMLEKVMDFPNILDLSIDANRDSQLFNMLFFVFPYYLKRALQKGIFKTYVRYQHNDGNVRGAIDVARHVKYNSPFVGKIAYNTRELSLDNNLMELIRHTVEFIKSKSFGTQILSKVKTEVDMVISCTLAYDVAYRTKVIQLNKKRPIRHAYYKDYRVLQRLCIMILQKDKHQIGAGVKQIHGILFDGAWLWEEYINTLIGGGFYHPKNKAGKGAQELFTSNNRKKGLIYPDFLSRNANERIIVDTKYKPVGNIGNKDYLQMLAYMFRFDSKQGMFVYPDTSVVLPESLNVNQGSTYESNVIGRNKVSVNKVGFQVPTNFNNYDEFKEAVALSELKLIEYCSVRIK